MVLTLIPLMVNISSFDPDIQSPGNCIPVSRHNDWKTVSVKEGSFKMELPSNYSGGMKTEEGEKVFSVSRSDNVVAFTYPLGKLNSYSSGCLPVKAPDTIYIHFGGTDGAGSCSSEQIHFLR